MLSNYTLAYPAQLACRNPNTTIPEPPFTAKTAVASCVLSNYHPASSILFSTCCHTSAATRDHLVTPNTRGLNAQTNLFDPVPTGGYEENGCVWKYCNVTGQSGVEVFEKCISSSASSTGTGVQGKCFLGQEAIAQGDVTSDGTKIKWRSDKKKDTVSAALLLALGVAGLIIGGA